jgi:ketol-acid reductoisomerase
MNERIKELMIEAGSTGTYQVWFTRNEVHKLAELIVQECARLAMTQHCSTSPADYGDMETYEQGCDDTASRISGLIRRTFGV